MRTIPLLARLDNEAVRLTTGELQDALRTGGAIIDGSAVEQIGLAGLQMLLSATSSAVAEPECRLTGASPALIEAAALAGLSDALRLPSGADL